MGELGNWCVGWARTHDNTVLCQIQIHLPTAAEGRKAQIQFGGVHPLFRENFCQHQVQLSTHRPGDPNLVRYCPPRSPISPWILVGQTVGHAHKTSGTASSEAFSCILVANRILLKSFSSSQWLIPHSVWRSGPVRSFGLKSLGPRPRPVFQYSKTAKNRTEPMLTGPQRSWAVFFGYKTGLNQLRLRPVHNQSRLVLYTVSIENICILNL